MVYDLKPLGYDDVSYVRTVLGEVKDELFHNLGEAIDILKKEFKFTNVIDGVAYDHDYGIAFMMTPRSVADKDYEVFVVDNSISTEKYLYEVAENILNQSKEI